jgi:putative two-component system response regulator
MIRRCRHDLETENSFFVDDEPRFLSGISRMLHKYRDLWDLDFTGSVNEALSRLSDDRADLVVTDINMPGKSGFDLLRAIIGDDSLNDIPVVVLTGNAEIDLKSKALELGAADLLNKPVVAQDLIARIKSTLRLKAYQDEIKEHNLVLERKVAERTVDIEISRLEILWRLAKAGEYRDEDTGNHTVRVGLFTRILAEHINMTGNFSDNIFLTSPLHDIGKIGIPDGILLKKGKLGPEEWNIMRRHSEIGNSILQDEAKGVAYYLLMKSATGGTAPITPHKENHLLAMAAEIALSHHERWDGRGYPKGLKKDSIPISARITSVADVYDALKSKRPYKPAFSDERTLAVIKEERGKQFDPDVVDVFLDHFDQFRTISLELQDNEPEPD